MTTGKRQIPINDRSPGSTGRGDRPGGPAQPGTGDGLSTAHPSPASAARPDGAAKAATAGRETLQAETAALTAERDALVAERDALSERVDALTDARLRLQAEFDNFRKRASRESFDAHVRTQCAVLSDFLPVLDNLERALDAAEHHEEGKVLDGVRMTRDMFVGLMTRAGVEEIEGAGAPFDPEVHDAMLVQPSEQEEGRVAAVIERGYRQGDRVLRPARVIVSAGRAGTDQAASAGAPTGASGSDGRNTIG